MFVVSNLWNHYNSNRFARSPYRLARFLRNESHTCPNQAQLFIVMNRICLLLIFVSAIFTASPAIAQQDLLLASASIVTKTSVRPTLVLPTTPNVRFFPKEIMHEGWMRFDNPAREPHYLELVNTEGQCVWQGRDGGSGSIQLNVAHLAAGNYNWKLSSIGGEHYEGELILQ